MQSSDKYAGGLVGWHGNSGVDSESALADAAIDEVCFSSSEGVQSSGATPGLLTSSDASTRPAVGTTALAAALGHDGRVVWSPVPNLRAALDRTVAQSQMASMLTDGARNSVYAAAITRCVAAATTALGRAPVVLDIGAGTGLLSMLAAQAGAGRVYAVEQWDRMARICHDVTRENFGHEADVNPISVYNAHSSALQLRLEEGDATHAAAHGAGDGGVDVNDPAITLPQPADVVISEILDSALLGEGVIPSLTHAYKYLMSPEARANPACCVPASAELVAQLVYAPQLDDWHATHALAVGLHHASVPLARKDWKDVCAAPSHALPVHVSALQPAPVPVTLPFTAQHCDFTPATLLARAEAADAGQLPPPLVHRVPALAASAPAAATAAVANGVVYWWRCRLWGDEREGDDAGAVYDTSVEAVAAQGWQDHWVQCVVPLGCSVSPAPLPTADGGAVGYTVVVMPSDMASSFLVAPGNADVWPSKRMRNRAIKEGRAKASDAPTLFTDPEPCTCGLHNLATFERRWMLADAARRHVLSHSAAHAARAARALAASRAPGAIVSAAAGGDADACVARLVSMGEGGIMGLAAAAAAAADDDGDARTAASVDAAVPAVPLHTVTLHAVDLDRLHTSALAEARKLGSCLLASTYGASTDNLAQTIPAAFAQLETLIAQEAATAAGTSDADEVDAEDMGSAADEGEAEADEEEEEEEEEEETGCHTGVAPRTGAAASGMLHALCMEPYLAQMTAHPLWSALSLWMRRSAIARLLAPGAVISPARARIQAQAVRFHHLARNHGTLGSVCGFSHAAFDAAEAVWHEPLYAYPVWQYAYDTRSAVVTLGTFDYTQLSPFHADALLKQHEYAATLSLTDAGANAVLLWADFDLPVSDGFESISSHPAVAPYSRQNVQFLSPGCAGTLDAAAVGERCLHVALHIERAMLPSGGKSYKLRVAASAAV